MFGCKNLFLKQWAVNTLRNTKALGFTEKVLEKLLRKIRPFMGAKQTANKDESGYQKFRETLLQIILFFKIIGWKLFGNFKKKSHGKKIKVQ